MALSLFSFHFKAMGSPCELQVYAGDAATAQALAAGARQDIDRLEQRYSRYRADSLLSDINRVAEHGGRISVDAETASLLDYAAACHAQSDGLFDITSGLLRRAWDFKSGKIPTTEQLGVLLQCVGWQRLEWQSPHLQFSPGMELDMGGIVKEYAADRIASLCSAQGIRHGFVNLGGDIRVIGPAPDGSPWQIGIKHPRTHNTSTVRQLALSHGAVTTSGDYERCMLIDGKRYSHILNPRTGWPVQGLASVTVIADFCVLAGSASTIAMLKEKDGPRWLSELGLPHLWIDSEGNQGGTLG